MYVCTHKRERTHTFINTQRSGQTSFLFKLPTTNLVYTVCTLYVYIQVDTHNNNNNNNNRKKKHTHTHTHTHTTRVRIGPYDLYSGPLELVYILCARVCVCARACVYMVAPVRDKVIKAPSWPRLRPRGS